MKIDTPESRIDKKVPDAFKTLSFKMHAARNHDSDIRNTLTMLNKVTTKPNPFSKSITIDIACDHSRHVIVRLSEMSGRIIRMFGWYLMKGTNITAINDLGSLKSGEYQIDIIDQEGNILSNTPVKK